MSATPKDRQRIIELVNAGTADKSPIEATVRAIHQEMPHLTADEVAEVCSVAAEEHYLDAADYKAQAEASKFIGDTLRKTGHPNLISLGKELIPRVEQGDQQATELLEQLNRAYVIVGDWIRVR